MKINRNRVGSQSSWQNESAYEASALTTLRNCGYRITMPRVQVVRALADAEKPMSAYTIHEKIINAGGKIDVVSVYRILATLQECGLVVKEGKSGGYLPLHESIIGQDDRWFTLIKNYTQFEIFTAGYVSADIVKMLQNENPDFFITGARIELELAPK